MRFLQVLSSLAECRTYSLDRWNSHGGTTDEFVNDVVSNMDLIMLNTADDELINQYLLER